MIYTLKQILNLLGLWVLTVLLLYILFSVFKPDYLESYLSRLDKNPHRYGEFNSAKKIRLLYYYKYNSNEGLDIDNASRKTNRFDNDMSLIGSEYNAYLGPVEDITRYLESNPNSELKITGHGLYRKSWAFLVPESVNYIYNQRKTGFLSQFIFLLSHIVRFDFGKTETGRFFIGQEVLVRIVPTMIVIALSAIFTIIISIFTGFLISLNKNRKLRGMVQTIINSLSYIPDFIYCILLMLLIITVKIPVKDSFFFRGRISDWLSSPFTTLYYFSWPALILTLANGNIAYLLKTVNGVLDEFLKSDAYLFLTANSLKKRYLIVIMLKLIMPEIISYVSMKIPLMIGAIVIIERYFSINGIGSFAADYFTGADPGVIFAIVTVLLLISIFFNALSSVIVLYFKPRLRLKESSNL